MSKYTDKQFEDIIMPWWDNLSLNKKEELTIKNDKKITFKDI